MQEFYKFSYYQNEYQSYKTILQYVQVFFLNSALKGIENRNEFISTRNTMYRNTPYIVLVLVIDVLPIHFWNNYVFVHSLFQTFRFKRTQ